MSNFRMLRLYRLILIVLAFLIGCWGFYRLVNNSLITADFISVLLSIVGVFAVSDIITLLLDVFRNSNISRAEIEQSVKVQKELLRQVRDLSLTVENLRGAIKSEIQIIPNEPRFSASTTQSTIDFQSNTNTYVRARVKSEQNSLFVKPDGDIVFSITGAKLTATQGQGIYLKARSQDGKWYKFSPDKVSDAWIKAEELQLLELDKINELPIEE